MGKHAPAQTLGEAFTQIGQTHARGVVVQIRNAAEYELSPRKPYVCHYFIVFQVRRICANGR